MKLDIGKRVLRILIEISEQDIGEALAVADGIAAVLEDGDLLPGGTIASGNAALVAAAVEVYRSR